MDAKKSNYMTVSESTDFRLPQSYPSPGLQLDYKYDTPIPHHPPVRGPKPTNISNTCETCIPPGTPQNSHYTKSDTPDYYHRVDGCYFAVYNAYSGKRFAWE